MMHSSVIQFVHTSCMTEQIEIYKLSFYDLIQHFGQTRKNKSSKSIS